MFGKYAAFVIPSYLACVIVLVGVFIWIRSEHARYKKEIDRLEDRISQKKETSNG